MPSLAETIFDSLKLSERLPRPDLDGYVEHTLARIVSHAHRSVPFYRERLNGVLRADGMLDRDRWKFLPPLSREDLQGNFDALTSTQIPENQGEASPRSTSGTTGKPVTILVTERTRQIERALLGRFYSWIGVNPGHRLVILQGARHPLLRYREPVPEPWVPSWMTGPDPGFYSRMHYPASAQEQLAYLASQGPVYFNTQPSNFRRVMNAARSGKEPIPQLSGFISIGEMVTAQDRKLACEVFGCEIFDTYSATDVGTIAMQCSHGCMHVNSEIIHVETVRADNSPCDPGEEGRILLTTLMNGAMPLLRYDIGDIGALPEGGCGCGLSLPRLSLTVGRERQLFRFSDGSVALPVFRMEKFNDIFPVNQWQLVQTGPEQVELKFSASVPDDKLAYDEIAREIRTSLDRPLHVTFERCEGELTGATGKLEPAFRAF